MTTAYFNFTNMTSSEVQHLNITVDSGTLENDLKKVIRIIKPNWNENKIHFKGTERAASAGLLNIMVVCYCTDMKDAVMCRIYREMKFNEYLTRKHEAKVMQIIHDLYGFAANVLATLNNGCCYEYIVGEVMSPITIKLPDNWRLIAKQIALLHSSKPNIDMQHKGKFPDFFESLIPTYPDSLPNPEDNKKFQKYLPSKSALMKEYNLVKDYLLSVGSEIVFCHGDVRSENMVWNKESGQITFVDWECSGMCKQAFELAYHFMRYTGVDQPDFSMCPDKEFQLKWLRVYLQTYFSVVKPNVAVKNSDVEKLYVQVKAQYLLLMIQSAGLISSINQFDGLPINFLDLSILHYNEYNRVKEATLALKLP